MMTPRSVLEKVRYLSKASSGWLAPWVPFSLVAAMVFFPLSALWLKAFSRPLRDIGGFVAASSFVAALLDTLLVCGVASVVALCASFPQAWVVSTANFRHRFLADFLALLPLLLAPYMAAGAWAGLDWGDWFRGRIPMGCEIGFSCAPWCYAAVRVACARLPSSMGELARSCGLGWTERVRKVWLPALSAPLAACALFAVARAFGDYGTAERNAVRTIGVSFHDVWAGTREAQVAALLTLLCALPAFLAIWSARKAASGSRTMGGQAVGFPFNTSSPLIGWKVRLFWGWVLACALAGFILPEARYVAWAVAGSWMPVGKAIKAAWEAFSGAAAIGLGLGAIGALGVLMFRPSIRAGMPEKLSWVVAANLFLPPMGLALAWIFATADGSMLHVALGKLRSGRGVLWMAQAFKLAPFALLPVLDVLTRERGSLRELARSAGFSWVGAGVLALRVAAPAVGFGALLAFMEALKELELALTLQPFGYATPAIRIHALARFHSEEAIASWMAVCQLLMLPGVAALALWLGKLRREPARG